VPHSIVLSFYTIHLEISSLDVLRVLEEQTLENNKEVKYPYVPGPSLDKEVKDSCLTILFNHMLIYTREELDMAQIWRFSVGGAHCLEEIDSI
jgi:hypothetical protein